jgi:hypothetical protein
MLSAPSKVLPFPGNRGERKKHCKKKNDFDDCLRRLNRQNQIEAGTKFKDFPRFFLRLRKSAIIRVFFRLVKNFE